jgi:hypothetical protein
MSNGITIYTDPETGITREYREIRRKAKVGDLVKVASYWVGWDQEPFTTINVGKVEKIDHEEMWIDFPFGKWVLDLGKIIDNLRYVVLLPTDIIHYNGKRYREAKRRARNGELVQVVYAHECHAIRDVGKVFQIAEENGDTCDGMIRDHCVVINNGMECALYHEQYVVLEPVTGGDPDTDRLTALEQKLEQLQKRVDELERHVGNFNTSGFTKKTQVVLGGLHPELVVPLKKQYTRAEVIELAKRDVEQLSMYKLCNVTTAWGSLCNYDPSHDKVEFVVNRAKRTVVALIKYGGGVWARGIAKCAPDDCFNFHIGKAIALRRALGLDVPDYYINAPQPTEAHVGDVVRTARGYVMHVVPDGEAELYVNKDKICISDVGFYLDVGGMTIIDDSHDYGGREV